MFTPRVLLVIFDPLKEMSSRSIDMTHEFIKAIDVASKGKVKYRLQHTEPIYDFPELEGGKKYTIDSWREACADNTKALRNKDGGWLNLDYTKAAKDWSVYLYDEVWMWGGGYFGFYESRLVGERGFFLNSPPVEVKRLPPKVFMGFNWERQTDQALHAHGHKVEFIMRRAKPLEFSAWVNEIGTVHTKKGQYGDYEYGTEGHAAYIQRWHNSLFADWWRYIVHPRLVAGYN